MCLYLVYQLQLSIIQVSTDWVLCVQYTGWVILRVYGLNVWYHCVYANLLTECVQGEYCHWVYAN